MHTVPCGQLRGVGVLCQLHKLRRGAIFFCFGVNFIGHVHGMRHRTIYRCGGNRVFELQFRAVLGFIQCECMYLMFRWYVSSEHRSELMRSLQRRVILWDDRLVSRDGNVHSGVILSGRCFDLLELCPRPVHGLVQRDCVHLLLRG